MSDQEKLKYVDLFVTHADVDHLVPQNLLIEFKHIKNARVVYYSANYDGMSIQRKKEKSPLVDAMSRLTGLFGNQSQRITRPPGSQLDAFASFLFKKCYYETVLKPCLADMQKEYCEALSEGRSRKAQWVWIRGVGHFWWHIVKSATDILKRVCTLSTG
jgi:hypothetical protein